MSTSAPIALVFHGHFYQPPRENPWTDRVSREPSAAPHHDWNERIHAESYRANAFARIHAGDGRIQAIVNNYDRLSFNFGPTLARWMGRYDPAVEDRLRAADLAQRRRLGAGGALAQAYAHPIVPLCNAADRRTQILWGLQDFERRFGRRADGIWLPETGVSTATLATLIDLGVKFTILGPEQIDAVRPLGGAELAGGAEAAWKAVDRDTLDTGRGYLWRHPDGSGRSLALAVFDGPLSRAVAFGDAAARAETLLDAALAAAGAGRGGGQRLVLCASDGELWGHHKRFADLTLAFATHVEAQRRGIEITNLGAYLARHPPTHEAHLAPGPDGEGTAWSCAHGLGRWRRDCGCRMSDDGSNQAWRGPLRKGLDLIRDAAAAFYEDAAGQLLLDPWGARDAYGAVVDEPLPARDRALAAYGRPALAAGGDEARTRARLLLELERATLLMYASCGWFFDDIAGLEASLIIRIGAYALDLMKEAGAEPPTEDVLDALAAGKSNRREEGTGADVFRRMARDRVTAVHAVGAAAFEALVDPSGAEAPAVPGFDLRFAGELSERAAGVRAVAGEAEARNRRTGIVEELTFEATARLGGELAARVGGRRVELADLPPETQAGIVMAALPALVAQARSLPVAELLVAAAREMPPDGATASGLGRRQALAQALRVMLGDGNATPTAGLLRLAADLFDRLALPGGPERRAVEERVWELLVRGQPTPPLRALAERLGFTQVAPAAAVAS